MTKHVFCVDSALYLLPQGEVTQLISLSLYIGTTQLSTTNQVRSMQVNCPQDSSSAAIYIAGLKKIPMSIFSNIAQSDFLLCILFSSYSTCVPC